MTMPKPRVGFFVTCLVDLYRPSVGFAAFQLLQQAGCDVDVPLTQTCCGQPAYNSGDREGALKIARQWIDCFDGFDYVVAPSASCVGMIRNHLVPLVSGDDEFEPKAKKLAGRTYELTEFLVDVMKWNDVKVSFPKVIAYHDSCSSLREIKLYRQPRDLLQLVEGLKRQDLPDAESCCGFGGAFCAKFPEISRRIAEEKVSAIEATSAEAVIGADLGCLLNIAHTLERQGKRIEVRHIAEVLAGISDSSSVGE